jgi:hypothetical protein
MAPLAQAAEVLAEKAEVSQAQLPALCKVSAPEVADYIRAATAMVGVVAGLDPSARAAAAVRALA